MILRQSTCILAIALVLPAVSWGLAGGGPAPGKQPGAEQAQLVGRWQATEGAWRGTALTREQLQRCQLWVTPPGPKPGEPGWGSGQVPPPSGYVNLEVPPQELVWYTIPQEQGKPKTIYLSSLTNFTLGLEPTTAPKAITLFKLEGIKGITFQGIHQLERDTLQVCLNLSPGRERPREFRSPRNSELLLLRLKRVQ